MDDHHMMPEHFQSRHVVNAGIELGMTLFQLTKEVAEVVPIPGLAPAAMAVSAIITICQNVSINKREAMGLANRCVFLLDILKNKSVGLDQNQITAYASESCRVFERIATEVERWSNYSRLDKVFMRRDISRAIVEFHKEIDSRLVALGVIANVETGRWQEANDQKRLEDHQELLDQLDIILKGVIDTKDQVEALLQQGARRDEQLVYLMGLLQERAGGTNEDTERRDLEKRLVNIKTASGQLPPKVQLQARQITFLSPHPVKTGDRYDVLKGVWMEEEEVSIKLLRGVEVSSQHFKRFWRESEIWRDVWEKDRGKYFVPYYGTVNDQGPYPYMISPWQKNGTATEWVRNKTLKERLALVKYVGRGIQVLHNWDPNTIVHGDIRGENMLIDDNGNPRLADFGLAKILEYATGTSFTQSSGISQSFRWFAPELSGNNAKLTTGSDIFSFGMSIIELMSAKLPFAEIKSTPTVLLAITSGKRPKRPQEFTDDNLWAVVEACLSQDVQQRPSIDQVLPALEKVML